MTRGFRVFAAVSVLALGAVVSTGASAKGFGGGHFGGGFGHGHGHFGGGHWGGHGHRGWGGGWGGVSYAPVYYGGCRVRRFVDVYGDLVVRRICD
ncbi:hypothetical protein [Methylobacterium brachythecii]|uniref:Sulfur globule protein n=1 Tax=Methylobacterium brachythecii TaxID=1176177 RepID=A0A7W6ALM3_9HYPH|nr:hypothetical protein [Methylobacterium brachythecii]MBB3905710.1 hypothetical protein [Methylobacterium brachythecii]GLS47080.1 hypothetical protein GCM10007884_50820 [Methylobacterium brachythecii]